MADALPPRPWIPVLERAFGGLLILFVMGTYGVALARGHMPPGHPWSGTTLALLGLRPLLFPVSDTSARQGSRRSLVAMIVSLLAVSSAMLWAWSTRQGG